MTVVPFTGITKLDIPPDDVLEGAKGKTQCVVLIGWDNDGELYFASSVADGGETLWLLEQAKRSLLNQ